MTDIYYIKYLKYKNKYLELKKKINQNAGTGEHENDKLPDHFGEGKNYVQKGTKEYFYWMAKPRANGNWSLLKERERNSAEKEWYQYIRDEYKRDNTNRNFTLPHLLPFTLGEGENTVTKGSKEYFYWIVDPNSKGNKTNMTAEDIKEAENMYKEHQRWAESIRTAFHKRKSQPSLTELEQNLSGGMFAVGMPTAGIAPVVGGFPFGMSRVMIPPYGLVYTTLKSKKKDDDKDKKKSKIRMAFVPGMGWILTSILDDGKDEKNEDGSYKTRYFFIPGRGMVAYNKKYSGLFPMVLKNKPISVLPNYLIN